MITAGVDPQRTSAAASGGTLFSCSAALEHAQCLFDCVLFYVPGYEHDARAAILARPLVKLNGRMENVLHAVNHDGARGMFHDIDDAFHAKEVVAAHSAHQIEPGRKSRPRDRLLSRHAKGLDPVAVAIVVT